MTPGRPLPLLLLLLLATGVTQAHPGHDPQSGFGDGFFHPVLGLDHLLAMVVVAWWAAGFRQAQARWVVPLGFLCGLTAGALFIPPSGLPVEYVIAGTVLGLGLLLALRQRPPLWVGVLVAMLIALPHGLAHAGELAGTAWLPGLLLASVLLHLSGGMLGQVRWRWLPPAAGMATALAGVGLLLVLWT